MLNKIRHAWPQEDHFKKIYACAMSWQNFYMFSYENWKNIASNPLEYKLLNTSIDWRSNAVCRHSSCRQPFVAARFMRDPTEVLERIARDGIQLFYFDITGTTWDTPCELYEQYEQRLMTALQNEPRLRIVDHLGLMNYLHEIIDS